MPSDPISLEVRFNTYFFIYVILFVLTSERSFGNDVETLRAKYEQSNIFTPSPTWCAQVRNKPYEELRKLVPRIRTSPFAGVCPKNPESVIPSPYPEIRPADVGPELLGRFYRDLHLAAVGELNQLKDYNTKMARCLSNFSPTESPDCTQKQLADLQRLGTEAPIARSNAIKMQMLSGRLDQSYPSLAQFGYKIVPWDPLTSGELREVQSLSLELEKIVNAEFENQLSRSPPAKVGDYCNVQLASDLQMDQDAEGEVQISCQPTDPEEVRALRTEFREMQVGPVISSLRSEYDGIMNKNVILQFVHNVPLMTADLLEASKEVDKSIAARASSLDRLGKELANSQNPYLVVEAADLLRDTKMVERFLKTHPKYCRLAAALEQMRRERRDTLQNFTSLAGLGAMAIPGGIPVVMGGYWMYDLAQVRNALARRTTSWYDETAPNTQSQVNAALRTLGTDTVMMVGVSAANPIINAVAGGIASSARRAGPVMSKLVVRTLLSGSAALTLCSSTPRASRVSEGSAGTKGNYQIGSACPP